MMIFNAAMYVLVLLRRITGRGIGEHDSTRNTSRVWLYCLNCFVRLFGLLFQYVDI